MMNIMKNSYLFLATAIIALASCSENTYLGEENGVNGSGGAISFEMSTPTLTRASGADAAEALGYKFKVYGVKKVGDTYSNVFAGEPYSSTTDYNYDPKAYWVWYNTSSAGKTTSNTSNWDYVGAAGTHGTSGHEATIASGNDQTIKYWDYSASQYEVVAYSATAGSPTITKYTKDGFTIQATAAELGGLYIADKLTISGKNNSPSTPATGSSTVNKIGDVIRLTFRNAATKVRLGIYETIPGYEVRTINFRPNTTGEGAEFVAATNKAKLTGSFNDNNTSSETTKTYTIAYNSTSGVAEFDATATAEKYFDFGTFTSSSGIGTTSTAPTWAGSTTQPYYQAVFPNTDNVGNMILYVDYQLYNTTTHETINVKGAKAVVPSNYMKWNPNYAYTYLFKISDNTNGITGTEGTKPEGLYPITFDAVTIAATDGQEVGTITTVSTPAITTYQKGSVYDNVSESKHGITYANANGPIYITVNAAGTPKELTTANTKLYIVASGTTEADLVLNVKEKTEVTSGTLTVPLSAEETLQGITFATSTTAKFTPNASTTYAVEYKVSDEVASVYTAVADETTLTKDKKYYTSNAGAGEFISNGTEVSNGSNYYEKTAGSPAVYQYKIIVVGS